MVAVGAGVEVGKGVKAGKTSEVLEISEVCVGAGAQAVISRMARKKICFMQIIMARDVEMSMGKVTIHEFFTNTRI